jgi:hypothetical protein
MQLFILCIYFLFFFLSLPYMFQALISPSSGVSQAVFLYTTIWFMWYLCCSAACARGLVRHGGFTVKPPRQTRPRAHADEQHKYYMNQMVVYKKTA